MNKRTFLILPRVLQDKDKTSSHLVFSSILIFSFAPVKQSCIIILNLSNELFS